MLTGVVLATEVEEWMSEADDVAAFEVLYRSEYAAVVRLAYSLTGRRDLAEELAQEGFLAVHRHWAKISTYDDPAAWVHRVVVNRCVSSGRRHLTALRLVARLSQERPAEPDLSDPAHQLWALVRALPTFTLTPSVVDAATAASANADGDVTLPSSLSPHGCRCDPPSKRRPIPPADPGQERLRVRRFLNLAAR